MNKKQNIFNIKDINLFLLTSVPIIFIILGFILDTPQNIFRGILDIVKAPALLLVDYIAVGGIGATFLNVGLLGLICIAFVRIFKAPLTGPLVAAVLTVIGFAFIGKTVLNVWPIFLGGMLYAKVKKINFGTILTPVFFSTALAPAVTHIAFWLELDYMISIPVAILVGMAVGFFVVPVAGNAAKFHDGHNLYNIGFTCGLIGTVIAASLKAFGFTVTTQSVLSSEYHNTLLIILAGFSIYFLIVGFILNNKSFKGYSNVLKPSGRGLGNFVEKFGFPLAYINFGFLGLISIAYVLIAQGTFNGPAAAGVFTVIAFGIFGKNPKNILPILMGVYLATLVTVYEASATPIIIAALFGTTLAPIAGVYGPIAGIVAGFMHVFVVSHVGVLHSGLNLYNNGFSGGIVSGLMLAVLQTFFKKTEDNVIQLPQKNKLNNSNKKEKAIS